MVEKGGPSCVRASVAASVCFVYDDEYVHADDDVDRDFVAVFVVLLRLILLTIPPVPPGHAAVASVIKSTISIRHGYLRDSLTSIPSFGLCTPRRVDLSVHSTWN